MSNRILIIDDEKHIRRMMRLTLETSGYEVGEAANGSEGISLFGDGLEWDGVVLDQRMPGMDGLETLRQIKERNRDARVVMATAYASIELAVDAMKVGASDFVRKPMTPETLRNAVAAALAKHTWPAAAAVGPGPQPGAEPSHPLIETITMNGFMVFPSVGARQAPEERRFTVRTPNGDEHEVLVQIDQEAVGYVERLTKRLLPPENSFWTAQAERVLNDFLWKEGRIPPTRRLTVREIDRDVLPVAERWQSA